MKHKLLIISALFIILGCEKDDDLPAPETIFCNCVEEVTIYNSSNRVESFRSDRFQVACPGPPTSREVEELERPGWRKETSIRCTNPD